MPRIPEAGPNAEGRDSDLLEMVSVGLCKTLNHRILWANEAFYLLFGYAPSELVGNDTRILYKDGADYERMLSESYQSLLAGKVYRLDLDFKRKDSSSFFCRLSGRLIDRADPSRGFIWALQDLSAEREKSLALANQAAELKLLMSSMANAFVVWGTRFDSGERLVDISFEYFNDAYSRIARLRLEDVQGKWISQVWPETERQWYEAYEEVALHGQSRCFELPHAATGGVYSCVAYRPWPDRSRICCVFEDVTEKRLAMEALRAKEERYRIAAEASGQLHYEYPLGGREVSWAGRIEQITGYGAQEFGQFDRQGFLALIHEQDRDQAEAAFSKAKSEGASFYALYRLRRRDGDYLSVSDSGSYLYDQDGKACRLIGAITDESYREKAESERIKLLSQLNQAAKLEAIGRLAGGVAHDFNNLLTVIMGGVSLARLHLGEEKRLGGYLDNIMQAAESAASLTRQLLTFSRQQIIQPKSLDLRGLLSGLGPILGRLLGEDIKLEYVLPDAPAMVEVDANQFEQVIINLAVNARDAMPQGGNLGLEISLCELDADYSSRHPETPPGPYVRLSVSDSGQGISQEALPHIFEPFYTTKAMGRGTGLGLSMVFGAVKQARGGIEVYSEPALGSCFKIYLPRAGESEECAEPAPAPLFESKGHEVIILVEDNPAVREVAIAVLSRLGYRLIPCVDAEEALMAAEAETRIDLLFTDVVLPGLNGRQLSERLRQGRPGLKTLFASGYTPNIIVHHGIVEKDIEFISKPYTLEELSTRVRQTLDGPGAHT